jgi:PAS domain S-box-containing protein
MRKHPNGPTTTKRTASKKRYSLRDGLRERFSTSQRLAPSKLGPDVKYEYAAQRYADLYDFSPTGYVTFDRSGRIEEINLTAEKLLGRPRERLIGMPFAVFVWRDDTALFMHHLLRCRCSDQRVETELRLKNVHREIIYAHLDSIPISSPANNGAVLFQTSIIDFTERKRFEVKIQQSQQRYRALFDLVPVAIYACDADGIVQEYNQRAVELWGLEPGLDGKRPRFNGAYRIYYPDGRPMPGAESPIARALRGKKLTSKDLEIVVERPDAEKRHVISAPSILTDEHGRITGGINCLFDITERKRAEQQLAEQARLLDLTDDAIIVRDLRDKVTYWNKGAEKMYGYSARQAAGKVTHKLLRTRHPEPINSIREKLHRDNNWSGELIHTRKDGRQIHVFSRWSLDRDVAGMPAFILESNTDITARKKAEAALQRSNEKLEQLVEQRTKALSATNVELKNEIERRKGLEGEILSISDREQQRLGQELHDGLCQHLTAVAFMARSVALRLKNHRVIEVGDIEKIAQLVNDAATDTRNLSRALHRLDVDAAGLVNALQDLVDREIWKTPCRLEVQPSFRVEDDAAAAHLYRIAREAVINANKHAQAREIVVRLERSRREIILRVIDDGVGLSREPQLKQGLGLHIMKYRSQSVGGRLEIDSRNGSGTRLSCYLPDAMPQKSSAKQNGHLRRSAAKSARAWTRAI